MVLSRSYPANLDDILLQFMIKLGAGSRFCQTLGGIMTKEQGKWIAGDTLCKQGEDLREIVEESLKRNIPIYHPTEKREIFPHTALKEIAQFTYQGKAPYFFWSISHSYDTLIIPENLFRYFDVEWNESSLSVSNKVDSSDILAQHCLHHYVHYKQCYIYYEPRFFAERSEAKLILRPKSSFISEGMQSFENNFKPAIILAAFKRTVESASINNLILDLYGKKDNTKSTEITLDNFIKYMIEGAYRSICHDVGILEGPFHAPDYRKIVIPIDFTCEEQNERKYLRENNNIFYIEYVTFAEKLTKSVPLSQVQSLDNNKNKVIINPRDIARNRLGITGENLLYGDEENEYADFLYHNEFDYIRDNNQLDLGEDYFVFDEEQYCKLYYYFDRKNGKNNFYSRLKDFRYNVDAIKGNTSVVGKEDIELNSKINNTTINFIYNETNQSVVVNKTHNENNVLLIVDNSVREKGEPSCEGQPKNMEGCHKEPTESDTKKEVVADLKVDDNRDDSPAKDLLSWLKHKPKSLEGTEHKEVAELFFDITCQEYNNQRAAFRTVYSKELEEAKGWHERYKREFNKYAKEHSLPLLCKLKFSKK